MDVEHSYSNSAYDAYDRAVCTRQEKTQNVASGKSALWGKALLPEFDRGRKKYKRGKREEIEKIKRKQYKKEDHTRRFTPYEREIFCFFVGEC